VVAHHLWVKCYNWVGIKSVRNYDIANEFCNFYVNGMSKKSNLVWKGMWVTLTLEILKHKNRLYLIKANWMRYIFLQWYNCRLGLGLGLEN